MSKNRIALWSLLVLLFTPVLLGSYPNYETNIYYPHTGRNKVATELAVNAWVIQDFLAGGTRGNLLAVRGPWSPVVRHVLSFDRGAQGFMYEVNSKDSPDDYKGTQIDYLLGEVSGEVQMNVDRSQKVHMCFYDERTRTICYSTNRSGEWITEAVPLPVSPHGTVIAVTGKCSMCLDASKLPHISYVATGTHEKNSFWRFLVHSKRNGEGQWLSNVVYENGFGMGDVEIEMIGTKPYMAVTQDSIGTGSSFDCIFLCWPTNNEYAHQKIFDGHEKNSLILRLGIGKAVSGPLVVFFDRCNLKKVTNASGSREVSTIAAVADNTSFDGLRKACFYQVSTSLKVSYIDESTDKLFFGRYESGSFVFYEIDNNADTDGYTSLIRSKVE